jgi:hypothetical protein
MPLRTEIIETTVGKVCAELARHGISSNERVSVIIETEQELIPAGASSVRVVAAGLTEAISTG